MTTITPKFHLKDRNLFDSWLSFSSLLWFTFYIICNVELYLQAYYFELLVQVFFFLMLCFMSFGTPIYSPASIFMTLLHIQRKDAEIQRPLWLKLPHLFCKNV